MDFSRINGSLGRSVAASELSLRTHMTTMKADDTMDQLKLQLAQYQEEELLRVFGSMKKIGGKPVVDYLLNYVQNKNGKYIPLIRPEDTPAIWLNKETMEKYRPEMKKYYYDPTKYKTYLEQLGIKYPTVRDSTKVVP